MKNLVTLTLGISLTLFSLFATAQTDITKIDKKAVAFYEQALALIDAAKYKEAIAALQQAIGRDDQYIDAYLSMAGVYGQLKDYKQSVATYEKAMAMDAAYTADYALPYSINLAGNGEFEKALQVVN
ncbi:MAG: tetratricopeptide repeat protein, partial [Chitinophagaceae bacterium]